MEALIGKLKDIAKDKTIPILTVDGELEEVLYREKLEKKVYESCGVSSKLINQVDYICKINNMTNTSKESLEKLANDCKRLAEDMRNNIE